MNGVATLVMMKVGSLTPQFAVQACWSLAVDGGVYHRNGAEPFECVLGRKLPLGMAWGTRTIRLDSIYDVEADLAAASSNSVRAAFQKIQLQIDDDDDEQDLLSGADLQQVPATLKFAAHNFVYPK